MQYVTCIRESSIYSAALTRGKRYEIVDIDEIKHQVRVRSDNIGRMRR